MQIDLSNVKIDKEEQLIELVKQLNCEIEFSNITKSKAEKEPLLDLEYLLKRYRKIKFQDDKKAFRNLYDCEYCLYYEKSRRCHATQAKGCPLELENRMQEKEIMKRPICPRNQEGNCPYGNEVGTCFGLCWKEILLEFYGEKG